MEGFKMYFLCKLKQVLSTTKTSIYVYVSKWLDILEVITTVDKGISWITNSIDYESSRWLFQYKIQAFYQSKLKKTCSAFPLLSNLVNQIVVKGHLQPVLT